MGKRPAQGEKSVLIVDDDVVCRLFCEQALAGAEHRILLAESAAAAIDLAQAWQPAVIVLDLHLRRCTGQAVKAIILRQWPRAARLPVFIAMTGDDQRVRDPDAVAGFSMILHKPFTAAQLRVHAGQALGHCPGIASASGTAPVSAACSLERALRAEWAVGLEELDRHFTALDWKKATLCLHRLRGAAAVAGHPGLAQVARRLMDEITKEASDLELTSAYVDFLWQGAEFIHMRQRSPLASPWANSEAVTRCESVVPFP